MRFYIYLWKSQTVQTMGDITEDEAALLAQHNPELIIFFKEA